jgi:TRAP-type C4-dicarboxylate transport system substrate-binding protein
MNMKMNRNLLKITGTLLICAVALLFPDHGRAARAKYVFKIASLAPEGSIWATRFTDFAEEVSQKSNGEISFKVYPGGVMGDDRSMYRKMRIGQLHGGGFTMSGISEVVPDFRVLGIPVLMRSYDEVDRLTEGLFPSFQSSFAKKGLVLLATTEVGFIYTMSANPISTLDQMRENKCWVPANDPVSLAFFQDIGIAPIQLTIPDVLSSLQTGLINTVFNSFYGSIVLQWFTKTPYITDVPFVYGYGALVFSKKAMDRLPTKYGEMIKEVARKHFSSLLKDTRKSNMESLKALQDSGVKLVTASGSTLQELETHRDNTIRDTVGIAYSKEIYDKVTQILSESRQTAAKKD